MSSAARSLAAEGVVAEDGLHQSLLAGLEVHHLLLDGVLGDETGRPSPGRCWPMRCARSTACASAAGFHQGSSTKQ